MAENTDPNITAMPRHVLCAVFITNAVHLFGCSISLAPRSLDCRPVSHFKSLQFHQNVIELRLQAGNYVDFGVVMQECESGFEGDACGSSARSMLGVDRT